MKSTYRLKAGCTVMPERGGAESQPQQRSPFNGLDPLDRSSGWPRGCGWSPTQPRSAGGAAPSSFGPGRGILSCAWQTATPERGCAESQPQQLSSFNGLDPLDRSSGWPRGCGWSPTQPRSAGGAAPSSFGPGRGILSCAWQTATPERGCAESQPQQLSSFNGLDPLDRSSGWPRGCGWSPTQPRSAGGAAPSSFGPGRRVLSHTLE